MRPIYFLFFNQTANVLILTLTFIFFNFIPRVFDAIHYYLYITAFCLFFLVFCISFGIVIDAKLRDSISVAIVLGPVLVWMLHFLMFYTCNANCYWPVNSYLFGICGFYATELFLYAVNIFLVVFYYTEQRNEKKMESFINKDS